jgi:eukaryotic-like serine/threonine-protein kinase
MSPEQSSGDSHRVDVRSDIYSLGVLLHHLVSTEFPPAVRRDVDAALCSPDSSARLNTAHAAIPPALMEIIAKATAIDQEKRYQTTAMFRDALVLLR